MPRLDNDIKLDFKDVLIRPKRSTLKSRADVDLTREFIFRNSKKTYTGIPIIASNMDTVGTFEMAIQLSKVSVDLLVSHSCISSHILLAESFHHDS
jgi:GMP reductase